MGEVLRYLDGVDYVVYEVVDNDAFEDLFDKVYDVIQSLDDSLRKKLCKYYEEYNDEVIALENEVRSKGLRCEIVQRSNNAYVVYLVFTDEIGDVIKVHLKRCEESELGGTLMRWTYWLAG